MFVLCVGMYRAGSTWQYDVVASLVERYRGGRRLGFIRGEEFALLEDTDAWQVLKSHDAHPAFACALRKKRRLASTPIVTCAMWPFHSCTSFPHLFSTLWNATDFCMCAWTTIVFGMPSQACWSSVTMTSLPTRPEALHALAGHVGVTLSADEELALGAEYSLEANRQRMQTLIRHLRADGVDLSDPANALEGCATTLVHWNHIREDQTAGWRQRATPVQRGILAAATAEWLIEREYEKDLSWLFEVFRELRSEIARDEGALQALQEQLAPVKGLGPGSLRLARFAH